MKSSIVHPSLLKLYLDNVVHISDHAFASGTFDRLQILNLLQMDISTLGPNTLNGLTALRQLRLDNVRLLHLPDFLHGVAQSLDRLEITGALTIECLELLSGVPLPLLSDIRLRLNARNVIGPTVFRGAVSLSFVDMQNCRIEFINPRVFYPFRRTLTYLNLVGNRLKSVSAELFEYLLPSINLKVYLFDNPWNCECELVGLKNIVEKHSDNFPGPIVCTNPVHMMGRPIRSSSFCLSSPILEPPVIEIEEIMCNVQSATLLVTEEHSTLSQVRRNIHNGNASFVLFHEDYDDTKVTVSEPNVPEIRVFNEECICKGNYTTPRYVPLARLDPNQVYLLCVHKFGKKISKCLAYFHPKKVMAKSVWLTNSKKQTFLVGVAVAMLILMTLGFLIGTIVFRKNPDETDEPAGLFTNIEVSHKLIMI